MSQMDYGYDQAGQLVSQTDGDGNVTKLVRNADGEVILQQVYNSAGTLVSQQSFGYDLADEQTSLTDGDGNTTSYTRNAKGQVTHKDPPNASGPLTCQLDCA